MATVNPLGTPQRRLPRGAWIVLGLAAVALALLLWQLPTLRAKAELGTAFGARIGCSCRYVEGRSLDSCKTDFEPGMELVSLVEDVPAKRLTASVPLLASRTVGYDAVRGCQFIDE